ncbi:MAG TPA: DinB family protein [Candidatus Angelobacter sp.]|nr:DinB family protein [Candidatus Angelobacter sp.]
MPETNKPDLPEPWLRGTLTEVPAVQRAVLHALELAEEDLERWCGKLTDEELNLRPAGIAPVAFHLRHIARSLDRLLTYAEGRQLSGEQIAVLKTELDPGGTHAVVFAELRSALAKSAERVRAFQPNQLDEPRGVGKKQMPTTVAGLLVHVADHTLRHVGQAITTAKVAGAQSTAIAKNQS